MIDPILRLDEEIQTDEYVRPSSGWNIGPSKININRSASNYTVMLAHEERSNESHPIASKITEGPSLLGKPISDTATTAVLRPRIPQVSLRELL